MAAAPPEVPQILLGVKASIKGGHTRMRSDFLGKLQH